MIAKSDCPICGSCDWQFLASKTLDRQDHDLNSNAYLAKRLRVFFEVWFPHQDQIVLTCQLCKACGFITNDPRVEEVDIDSKYHFLEMLGQDYGSQEREDIQVERSKRLYGHVRQYLSDSSCILDFGGGDGRLMLAFQEAGHHCFLVDYNRSPREGVIKVGDTIEKANIAKPFDAIVCNHVIEHVADPVQTLNRLARHLQPNGVLQVEVPMEVWRRPPLWDDPVTHVNFFVAGSLERAIQEAGLRVLSCKVTGYLHPGGKIRPAVLAIASLPARTNELGIKASGYREAVSNLHPGLLRRLMRKWQVR